MEHPAQTVPAKVLNHRHAVAFDVFLDRRADVTKGAAGFDRRDPHHQRLMGYLDQPLGLAGQLAGHKHPAGVAIPTVDDNGHVDIQDVASLQLFLLAGYAGDRRHD